MKSLPKMFFLYRCPVEVAPLVPGKGNLQGLAAAFVRRTMIACGGSSAEGNITNECFEYSPRNSRLVHFTLTDLIISFDKSGRIS